MTRKEYTGWKYVWVDGNGKVKRTTRSYRPNSDAAYVPHSIWSQNDDVVRGYVAQDFDRMESLYAGNWSYIGIRAEAKIVVNGTIQTISSGGLWGIESDSDESHFAEVGADELADLRTTLHEMGFSKRAIASACKDIEKISI